MLRDYETKVSDGLEWVDRGEDSSDDHLAFTGHERGLVPFMKMLADPDRVYINVGAHVGTWALRMADFATKVYAIEGNPATFEALETNIWLNSLQSKVKPIQAFVWDKDTSRVEFVDVNDKVSGGSTRAQESTEGYPTNTLDTLIYRYVGTDQVGFVQMDVEGAEARVLRGSHYLLTVDRPNILIELHENHPGVDADIRDQVYSILEKYRYNYYSVDAAPNEEHLICQPAERVVEYEPEIIKGVQ